MLPLDGVATTGRWIVGAPMHVFHRVIDIAANTTASPQPPVGPPPAPIVLRDNDPDRNAGQGFDGLPTGPATVRASSSGELTCQLQALFMTVEEPTRARLSLNWHRIHRASNGQWLLEDVLAIGSTVCFTFAPETRVGEQGTFVHVEHSGLPRVWTADFCAVWDCNLARLN